MKKQYSLTRLVAFSVGFLLLGALIGFVTQRGLDHLELTDPTHPLVALGR